MAVAPLVLGEVVEGEVEVVMERGCEGWWECECECAAVEGLLEEVAFPWMAEWARKAARKLAKKGRWFGIMCVFE